MAFSCSLTKIREACRCEPGVLCQVKQSVSGWGIASLPIALGGQAQNALLAKTILILAKFIGAMPFHLDQTPSSFIIQLLNFDYGTFS